MRRRTAMKLGAAAAALPLVHIRTAGAAGKVSIGFWDHWVPDGNKIMQQQVDTWAQQNKVDVHVDFITSVGNKLLLTAAAEAQAKTGHDCIALYMWDVVNHADALANHDDLLNRLIAKYGPVDATSTYMAKIKGHWRSLPDQLRHANQATLRADRLVQTARARHHRNVSHASGAHQAAGQPGPMTRFSNMRHRRRRTI